MLDPISRPSARGVRHRSAQRLLGSSRRRSGIANRRRPRICPAQSCNSLSLLVEARRHSDHGTVGGGERLCTTRALLLLGKTRAACTQPSPAASLTALRPLVVTQPLRMQPSCLRPFDANGRCHDGALLGMPPGLGCDHSLLRCERPENEVGGVRPRHRCGRSPQPEPPTAPSVAGPVVSPPVVVRRPTRAFVASDTATVAADNALRRLGGGGPWPPSTQRGGYQRVHFRSALCGLSISPASREFDGLRSVLRSPRLLEG